MNQHALYTHQHHNTNRRGVVLLVRPSIDRLREDIFGLQERMTRLERRIDELEGSMDVLRDLFVANNR